MKNVEDIYPLSPLQEGILFHSLKEPASGAYFEQYYWRITGDLDPSLYKRAWQTVINRHTTLRTGFLWEGLDQPLQVVRREVELDWVEANLDREALQHVDRWLAAYLIDDRSRAFDMSKAPLMRFRLFQMEANTYQWIWSYHHIVSDGWSTAIILKEVLQEYENLCNGAPTDNREKPIPYREFIAWLQTCDLSAAKRFWQKKLSGFSAPTPIPLRRPDQLDNGYRQIERSFTATKKAALEAMAKRQRLTLNSVIQGAWAVILNRYSGEKDIVFGATVSGRPATLMGVEKMVGLLINTLPVRAVVDPQIPFSEWLGVLQEKEMEARDFDYSPLAKVQSWSDVAPGSPLFDSIVVFVNYPRGNLIETRVSGLGFSDIHYKAHSNYPLALIVLPERELRLIIIYDRSRFKEKDIQRIFGHLSVLLQAFIDNPHQRIKQLPILTDSEQQFLKTWQNGKRNPNAHQLVHHKIASQSVVTPQETAVTYNQERLAYKNLEQNANQLARLLIDTRGQEGTPIGIFLHRSIEMITAIVAILKSGSAYVALDPTYPRDRLEYIVADSGLTLILTVSEMVPLLAQSPVDLLCIDDTHQISQGTDSSPPHNGIQPQDLAYILYTSGSTGTPKGVKVSHGNLAHATGARLTVYKDRPSRFLLLSSISFDSSVAGIFGTLCRGGDLHIPDKGHYKDIDYLTSLIKKHKISHMLCIPSLYDHMLQYYPARLDSLKAVIVAGEPCTSDLVDAHFSLLPGTQLFNEYGPTEATVWSTVYPCTPGSSNGQIPIGRPIENTRCHILDRHLNPVPPGIPGELCIGGPGVSQGYVNQPELTSRKFVWISDHANEAERIYRTGDLGCFRDDGNIAYLGRCDDQVKIRGYRIEPKEIENVLCSHPAVTGAAVVPVEREDGTKKLTAYVVFKPGQATSVSELRLFMQTKLPDFMIPAHMATIDQMPLTVNGKVDREALPKLFRSGFGEDNGYVAPKTELEEQVSSIWAKRLNSNRVGVTDNFFELGGDSLLALRLIADIKTETGIDISLSSFLKNPSIEHVILQQKNESSEDGDRSILLDSDSLIVPIQPKGSKVPVFLFSLPSEVLSAFDEDQPIYRFMDYWDELPFPYTTDRIEKIAHNYIRDLKKAFPQGPYVFCGYSANAIIAFEMARQLTDTDNKDVFLFLLDPTIPRRTYVEGRLHRTVNEQLRYASKTAALGQHPSGGAVLFVRSLFKKLLQGAKNLLVYLLFKVCKYIGYHFPSRWRVPYVLRMYHVITRRFIAQQYKGPVTLCLTQRHLEMFDWGKLFSGDVEYHIIRETNLHSELYHDKKIIPVWLNHLKTFVSRI